jgi:hypothetical protein
MRQGAAGLTSLLLLAACAGGPSPLDSVSQPAPAQEMAGRWVIAAPNAPTCGMAFSGAPGATSGRVAPEGGCPDRFFMSRSWVMDGNALVIADEESNTLATLAFANGRFEGQSAAGTPIQISRPAPPAGR